MPWIESHSTLIEHPKLREAARLLNVERVIMVGHLTCFWHKVIEFHEDGDISQWTEEDISYYAQWKGDPKLFYNTLKDRFIDEKNGFKLVHNWLHYAWKYLYSKYHTNNPKLLKAIKKKYNSKGIPKGQPKGQLKGIPKGGLPNQPNQPNLTLPNQDLKDKEKEPAPSAVDCENIVDNSKSENLKSGKSETPEKKVEDYLSGKTGFGKGGKRKDYNEFREQVKKVCLVWIGRLREWGYSVEEEKEALNRVFGMMFSLICYGVPRKPKGILNFKGSFTEPKKAIELIERMNRPREPTSELVDAFKKQPKYLR